MLIDMSKVKEVYVEKVKLLDNDERFFAVPNDKQLACTNYGRLYKRTDSGGYNKVPMILHNGEESYNIKYDSMQEKQIISIRKLLAMVFCPDEKDIYLYNRCWNPFDKKRWNVANLDVLRGKDELVEALLAKIEHRTPTYEDFDKEHGFVNLTFPDTRINKKLRQIYWNMYSRTTNAKVKELHPNYKDAKLCDEWFHDKQKFYDWCHDHLYYYPEPLSIDKDILSFSIGKEYSPDTVCFVPQRINLIFSGTTPSKLGYSIHERVLADGTKRYIVPGSLGHIKGEKHKTDTCATYAEALQAGRERKARFIRSVVAKEREKGYMPDNILAAMEIWADRCEQGLVGLWEPSDEIKKRMGVNNE